MSIIRLILFPFSLLYGAAMIIRNLLFDVHILKSYKSSLPVISVGNITAGGTGKTPVVIMLTELFTRLGKSVCVVSRGYGRETNGLVVGFDGNTVNSSAAETGDEMAMIINRFKNLKGNFFALSDSSRVNAVRYAEKNFRPDLIILDDAYQHRYVKRDIDIVVVSMEQKGLSDRTLIPAGNLREPFSCLCRADLILKNYKFSKIEKSYPLNTVPEIDISYAVEGFFNINDEPLYSLDKKFISVSGIAANDSFTDTLRKNGINPVMEFKFRDHHAYTEEDIREITSNAGQGTVFVTTEKDFIKLKNFANFIGENNLYFLKLRVHVEENVLLDRLKEKQVI